jgi:crotonobetainyl-CoA:carnitine CoA-transferase CaiB-like acyl-CoA transferase
VEPDDLPLTGLRVLDLASHYSAPLLSALLADLGADVVKVEPPGGDPFRGSASLWPLVARRKRSVVADIDDPAGADLVHALLAASQVVVENLPRHVAERRGLTFGQLRTAAPRTTLVTISGFGAGPYADRPSNGTVAEAFAGLTGLTGEADGPPLLASVPLGDAVVAGFAVGPVVAACWQAQRTGRGRHVEVAMYEPLLHVVAPALASVAPGAGEPQSRLGGRLPGVALRGSFVAADGRWLTVSCSTSRHEHEIAVLTAGCGPATAPLHGRFAAWVAGQPRDGALEALTRRRVPAVPTHDLGELLTDPHVQARGSLLPVHTDAGAGLLPAPAARFRDTGVAPAAPRLPAVGEHTAEVVREWLSGPAPRRPS